jgi:hypothetical protein
MAYTSSCRRPGTSPSFWNRYHRAQDAMIAACMPTLAASSVNPLPEPVPARDTRAVHPRFGSRKMYSA